MVQVKVKAVNDTYTVICAYDDFPSFLSVLYEKLQACTKIHCAHFEAFFHIQQDVSTKELMQILQCANAAGTIVLGLCQTMAQPHAIAILEQNLYSGQTYHFEQEILLLGSIGLDAFVTSSESIYCIGDVSGNIDLLHEDCILCASSFFQANIRICDSKYQNMTSFSPAQIYYRERALQMKEYKEEKTWAVQ